MTGIVLGTRKYKAGYEVREELHRTNFDAVPIAGDVDKEMQDVIDCIRTPSDIIVKSAYTPNGDYIGNSEVAHFLCVKKGIKPEKISPSNNKVCSIGFCEAEQKWYGWSHRAIFGFGLEKANQEIESWGEASTRQSVRPRGDSSVSATGDKGEYIPPNEDFRCVWANDNDKHACQVYRKHWENGELHEGDIRTVDPHLSVCF